VLPIELSAISWALYLVDWNKSCTREQLLTTRARQLERKDDNVTKAAHTLARNRQQNKDFFDSHRHKRLEELGIGDLILLFNSVLKKQWSRKLDNRWLGPYRIRAIKKERGTYLLEELDGRELKLPFPGEMIKKFYPRRGVDEVDE